MTNPFEFYGIAQKFNVDQDLIKKRYYEIAKEYHPDFFMNDEAAYAKALETTAANNKSFEILADFEKRTAFILEQNGLMKDADNKLPMDFLLEMMEMNEAIDALKMHPDQKKLSALENDLENLESRNLEQWHAAAHSFDQGIETLHNLEVIKDCHLKHKYFLRIKESLSTFATP